MKSSRVQPGLRALFELSGTQSMGGTRFVPGCGARVDRRNECADRGRGISQHNTRRTHKPKLSSSRTASLGLNYRPRDRSYHERYIDDDTRAEIFLENRTTRQPGGCLWYCQPQSAAIRSGSRSSTASRMKTAFRELVRSSRSRTHSSHGSNW